MNLTSLVPVFLLLAATKPPLVPTRTPEPRPSPAQGWEPASPTEVAEFCKTNKCRVPGPWTLSPETG
jgi:hypothetical protein